MSDPEFLRVSTFLSTEFDARAIKTGLELGIIDRLAAGPISFTELAAERRLDPMGMGLLIELLEINCVIARYQDRLELTPEFKTALRFRDLLECRIAFADLVWPDIHNLFTPLLTDLRQFMARSQVFDLFRYDRCLEVTPENLAATSAWTKFTTCLTKYEAVVVLDAVVINKRDRDFIDLGGNTGEFARQLCVRYSHIVATVVDLPVLCALGARHVAADLSTAGRISFFPCDMRCDALPPPADLVAFKSVLHDWPDAEAAQLLERARAVVRPGGRLIIFERAPIALAGRRITYAMAPDLVFFRFLRPADLYLKVLSKLGFVGIEHRNVRLETDFHLITAQRPS